MAIRLGENVCEIRKPLGWQGNGSALNVLLLNEAMGECVMTLQTFLSTAYPLSLSNRDEKLNPWNEIIGFP